MLEKFHQKLLGTDPPPEYRLTETHMALYEAFGRGKRGYVLSSLESRECPDKFLATLVVAIYQTTIPSESEVYIAVSNPIQRWAVQQIRDTARHIFSCRKTAARQDIELLRSAIQRLQLGSKVIKIQEEPPRWVAYGFHNKDLLPPWMRGRLAKV